MVIFEALKKAKEKIGERDAGFVFQSILKKNSLELSLHKNDILSEDEIRLLNEAVDRIKSGEPLQYVLGNTEFMSLEFDVNPSVLIPRSDTETLVEYIIENAPQSPSVLDIGTGSGCIAISLAHYIKNSSVTAMDISEKALETAIINAKKNNVDIKFVRHDIMTDFEGEFDIVVSNPPYIESDVIPGLDKNVKDFEPLTALDGGADGLDFYRRITKIAPSLLKEGGMLCFEVGHTQAQTVCDMMKMNFNTEIIRDLCGIDRVVAGRLICK